MAKLTQIAQIRYGFSVWKSPKFKPQFPGQKDEKRRGKVFSKYGFCIFMYNEDKVFRYGEDYYNTITTTEQLEAFYFQKTGETLTPVKGIN
mgnify:CR=1 FL=1